MAYNTDNITDVPTLKNEINSLNAQLKALRAQLEAAKQMINEGLNVSLQLRTNLHLFQEAGQDQAQFNTQQQQLISTLQNEVAQLKQTLQTSNLEPGLLQQEQQTEPNEPNENNQPETHVENPITE